MRFRKKPVVVDAYQAREELEIETLEGTMHASVGDWIITGVNGEKYPCKPDIFEKSYEPVLPGDTTTTNEERRKVVEEMRKMARKHRAFVFRNIAEAIGIDHWDYNNVDALMQDCWLRLSCLIEPEPERTCEMEYCLNWSGDELYPTEAYACSVCGNITLDGKPNYCPNCGAKVIDNA